jgi:hypothetical protein
MRRGREASRQPEEPAVPPRLAEGLLAALEEVERRTRARRGGAHPSPSAAPAAADAAEAVAPAPPEASKAVVASPTPVATAPVATGKAGPAPGGSPSARRRGRSPAPAGGTVATAPPVPPPSAGAGGGSLRRRGRSAPHGEVELVSGAEVARRLGVSRERVRQWAANPRYSFPPSTGRSGPAKLWRWPEVERWAAEHRRRPAPQGD